ncbi:SAM-dependent methyltransferase [Pelagibacteraceae bacterium]|jgi:NADH dehydrogenase [ubiquinone] 1 alpha subcomplex assembly factor 7|nr:SAM-dependent methyltransferase [Pelagibacteraceae bacterium]
MISLSKFFPKSKKISIDKFISNALYHKDYGYYSKKIPFGKKGDFITSPGVSSLFSELIALWIILLWEHMDKPKIFNIVELGPGNGQMCKVLLNVFEKFPIFFNSVSVFLYEKSKNLEKLQKDNLSGNKIKWIKNFNKIKKGPIIFVGNEFFDSIPIKQFKKKNNILYELFVSLENNNKIKSFLKKADPKTIVELKKLNFYQNQSFIEYPKQGLAELDLIIKAIKRQNGGLLLIDYGFLKIKNTSTLQSVKNHKTNMIFNNVGDADITSLVNFKFIKNYLKKKKFKVNNVVTQSFFLKKMGIINRAEIIAKKMNFKEKTDLYFRIERLINTKQMGELFKFLSAFKLKKKFSLGFD